MGVKTIAFGFHGWKVLEGLAWLCDKLPNEAAYIAFEKLMRSIGYILPCIYCRTSCKIYVNQLYEKNITSSRQLVFELHDLVNQKLKKTTNITYSEYLSKLESAETSNFWVSLTIFMGFVCCDYDDTMKPYLREFLESANILLDLYENPVLKTRFAHVLTVFPTFDFSTSDSRFDFVWFLRTIMCNNTGWWNPKITFEKFKAFCVNQIVKNQ